MERFVFIHGSSVGQSALVPAGAPELICNDIAAKYFQGRTLRQKESAARKAMFVDLYHSSQGIYSVYSFVNNACFGANGREGQYFAISILCKGVYIYPESIYSMLNSAYDTIFKNGKILKRIENGEYQYVISQFSEQKDYLTAFLKKVEEAFDKLAPGEGKSISPNVSSANYDSWRGDKVSLDVCNSNSALKALTEVGRLYISEEYESASVTINTLRAQVQRLQAEKTEIAVLTARITAERILILSSFFSSARGTVSRTTSSSIHEFCILSIAGPERTGCVQHAQTFLAPLARSASAPFTIVPAVSIISSTRITFLPSISPMIFITSETFGFGRRLSTIAIGTSILSANFLALVTLPRSGDTTTVSSFSEANSSLK